MVDPEVSVVVPTKDRWSLLSRAALPAALDQEDVRLELVVVDDGSTDGTYDHLLERAAYDPRLRILRHESPRGVSTARNTGITAARGEWVAFLDDDDFWSPRKLRVQLDAARRERARFVFAGAVAVDVGGRVLYRYYFPPTESVGQQLLESAVIPAGASNVLAQTELVREVGGFDERFLHLEDWDLWIRLAAVERPTAVPEVLVSVLFHSANKHAVHDQADEVDALIRKHAQLDPPRQLRVDRSGHARWVAAQHSRAGLHRRAAGLYLRAAVAHRSPGNVLRAFDALLAKRPSSTLGRLRGRSPRQAPASPPEWLAPCALFQRPAHGR